MQGPSEFCIGGILENWTTTERLATVKVPALILVCISGG